MLSSSNILLVQLTPKGSGLGTLGLPFNRKTAKSNLNIITITQSFNVIYVTAIGLGNFLTSALLLVSGSIGQRAFSLLNRSILLKDTIVIKGYNIYSLFYTCLISLICFLYLCLVYSFSSMARSPYFLMYVQYSTYTTQCIIDRPRSLYYIVTLLCLNMSVSLYLSCY